jgi:hypothetical protein
MATVDELLTEADIAMYRAKALGKGRCHVYRPSDGPRDGDDLAVSAVGGTVRRPASAGSTATRTIAPRPV